jgi:hypothetical protein
VVTPCCACRVWSITHLVIIGFLELLVCLVIVLSIVRGEFLPHRAKSLLLAAITLALLDFACLSLGQTSTGNTADTASLFTYVGMSAVIFLLVLNFRATARQNWVSARLRRPT